MEYYNIKETAKRIRELRLARGYAQQEAADHLGVDKSFLSRVEHGEKGCSVDLFIRMAEFYHVSLDYLIVGTLPKEPEWKESLNSAIELLQNIKDSI